MLRYLPAWALRSICVVAHPIVGTSLLIVVVADLALGGNGYLIKIGPLRIRELLFIGCMIWTAAVLLSRPEDRPSAQIWALLGLFIAVTGFGLLLGFLNDNFSAGLALNFGTELVVYPGSYAAILGELKPLAYFPMLLFFVTAIRSRREVTLVVTILMLAGASLATLYLLTLAAVHSGLVSYATLYDCLAWIEEIIFRIAYPRAPFVGFLYKGMYYACVAALLLMLDPFKNTKALALVAVLAVSLTLTRSLVVALGACIIIAMAWEPRRRKAQLAALLLLCAVVTVVGLRIDTGLHKAGLQQVSPAIEGERPVMELGRQTDYNRLADLEFVRERTTLASTVIGHGFAAKIGKRTKIELTYVEIFYKQGILGLAFWALLFAYSWWLYLRVPVPNKPLGRALLLCSLFFFISTAPNTVLTGSIGLGTVLIVIACLSVLAREPERVAWYGGFVGLPFRKLQMG